MAARWQQFLLTALLSAGACSGTDDGPPPPDCHCDSIVNLCLNKVHTGAKIGMASNNLAPVPTDVSVLVSQSGEMRVLGVAGMDLIGQIDASRCGKVSGSVTAFAQDGYSFGDASSRAGGSVAGKADGLSLNVEWQLASGDFGSLESQLELGVFAPADIDAIAGAWVSVDANGAILANFSIDGGGLIGGEASNGCRYDGRVTPNGSNMMDLGFNLSTCGGLDGDYAGRAVAFAAANGSGSTAEIAAIGIHVNTPERVVTDRWIRP